MKPSILWKLARTGRLWTLGALARLSASLYRICFLSAAGKTGLLAALAGGPASLERIGSTLGTPVGDREALEEWLAVGVQVGVLTRAGGAYALRGRLAKALVGPENDAALALLEEVVQLHTKLILETPPRLRQHRRFTLADQDGELVARSSRLVEPLVHEAIAEVVPHRGRVRLFEVGCGSGAHIRAAAALNPELTALGLELQPGVALRAAENLRAWGLSSRVEVEAGDVRARTPQPCFDVATLHNNIYYFPVAERTALLAHVRGFLRPGGRLLLTTGCRGRTPAMGVLSLWGAATEGCGRLPDPAELTGQLRQAGFTSVTARNLMAPFDRFHAFVGSA